MNQAQYTLGLDYGTNSCRATLMRIGSNEEIGSYTYLYPSGEEGILLDSTDPHLARQHPKDYIEGMLVCIKTVLQTAEQADSGFSRAQVVGLAFATTGSTVIPVNKEGVALGLLPSFEHNLHAMCWLWKDHTSTQEASEITELAQNIRPEYLDYCGGTYSSEWWWAKILRLKRVAPDVFDAAYSFCELCDFLPAILAGNTSHDQMKRSVCAAGHKAMYHPKWGGLPDKEFLGSLDPALADLRDRLYEEAFPSDQIAGTLNKEWAEKTGLPEGAVIAVGAFDAHMGAVGATVKEGTLVKIMGTSTCDIMVSNTPKMIEGVCGVVPDSVMPGYIGIEAGQSAVGDIFLWFIHELLPAEYGVSNDEKFSNLIEKAETLLPGQSGLLALDWNNGNRNILSDQKLSGVLLGQNLQTKAYEIYRALIEATAFGALKIIEQLETSGTSILEVVCCGGLAKKNAMMMQIYADVLGRTVKIAESEQTCAVGACIFAAAAATDETVASLQKSMTTPSLQVYHPNEPAVMIYKELYRLYSALHDQFGLADQNASLYGVMKSLMDIQKRSLHV